MRKCNSITLAWDASPDDVWYCINQRDADFRYSNFEESKELCNKIRPTKTVPVKRELNNKDAGDSNSVEAVEEDDNEEKRFTPTRQVSCRR